MIEESDDFGGVAEDLHVDEVFLEKLDFVVFRRWNKSLLKNLRYHLDTFIESEADCLVAKLEMAVFAQEVEERNIKYPGNWWEAVKERFAPKWFIKRWPVRYREVVIKTWAVYPNITLPDEDWRIHWTVEEKA